MKYSNVTYDQSYQAQRILNLCFKYYKVVFNRFAQGAWEHPRLGFFPYIYKNWYPAGCNDIEREYEAALNKLKCL